MQTNLDVDDLSVPIPDKERPDPPVTQRGDIWHLGNHRLLCGNLTDEDAVAVLLNEYSPDCLLTDPPYSSGGFQEAGKSSGSVGTTAKHVPVFGDSMSTRGYMRLMRSVMELCRFKVAYIFTDWKMWVYLQDVVEPCGYGLRSMIVWDKMFPGLGQGWRSQHELIMCAVSDRSLWADYKKGEGTIGNVLQVARSGNKYHTTEKPLDLITMILSATPFAATVFDPFIGSGTTMLACEKLERTCLAVEVDPHYCDVVVARWEGMTGDKAEKIPRTA